MAEINYNEARSEAGRMKNLLRAFERADEVLQAAETAEGVLKTHGPQIEELKAKRDQALREKQAAETDLEDIRRRTSEARGTLEAVKENTSAQIAEMGADVERAREGRDRKIKEIEQQLKLEHEKRVRELERELGERKKHIEGEINGLVAERNAEAGKLAEVKAKQRELAEKAAQAAGD